MLFKGGLIHESMGALKEDSNINKHTNIFREFTIIIYTLQIRSDFIPLIYDVNNIQSLIDQRTANWSIIDV